MRRPNGYGGIVKLSGKRRNPYQVRLTAGWENTIGKDGNIKPKQIIHVLGSYPTYQDAALALAVYNNDPYDLALRNITFAEAYKFALEDRQPLSESTMRCYKTAYNKAKNIYNKKLLNINKIDLQRIVDAQQTNIMQTQMMGLFHVVFGWAQEKVSLIKNNPSSDLRCTASPSESREGLPYTQEEIQLLWNHVDDQQIAGTVLIQIYLGVRIAELISIKKEDVHLDERWIAVKGTKTENATREVPIRKEIIPLIESEMNKSTSEYMMVNCKNKKPYTVATYSYRYRLLCDKLGLERHVTHDARHTFISRADDSQMNENALKTIVGHSKQGITARVYTHKDIGTLIDAVDKIKFL